MRNDLVYKKGNKLCKVYKLRCFLKFYYCKFKIMNHMKAISFLIPASFS